MELTTTLLRRLNLKTPEATAAGEKPLRFEYRDNGIYRINLDDSEELVASGGFVASEMNKNRYTVSGGDGYTVSFVGDSDVADRLRRETELAERARLPTARFLATFPEDHPRNDWLIVAEPHGYTVVEPQNLLAAEQLLRKVCFRCERSAIPWPTLGFRHLGVDTAGNVIIVSYDDIGQPWAREYGCEDALNVHTRGIPPSFTELDRQTADNWMAAAFGYEAGSDARVTLDGYPHRIRAVGMRNMWCSAAVALIQAADEGIEIDQFDSTKFWTNGGIDAWRSKCDARLVRQIQTLYRFGVEKGWTTQGSVVMQAQTAVAQIRDVLAWPNQTQSIAQSLLFIRAEIEEKRARRRLAEEEAEKSFKRQEEATKELASKRKAEAAALRKAKQSRAEMPAAADSDSEEEQEAAGPFVADVVARAQMDNHGTGDRKSVKAQELQDHVIVPTRPNELAPKNFRRAVVRTDKGRENLVVYQPPNFTMWYPYLTIKDFGRKGSGLVARTSYEKDDLVLPYSPRKVDVSNWSPQMVREYERKNHYLVKDGNIMWDGTNYAGGLVNQGTPQTVNVQIVSDPRLLGGMPFFQAIREIRPGDELLTDYEWSEDWQIERFGSVLYPPELEQPTSSEDEDDWSSSDQESMSDGEQDDM